MKQVVGLAILAWNMSILRVTAANLPGEGESYLNELGVRQCVVVLTASLSTTNGTMLLFERDALFSDWKLRRSAIPVVVGKRGLAWGYGIAGEYGRKGRNMKHEGDNKAPAGVFELRGVFGYAARAETKMPYQQVTSDILCIDDPQSRRYNQLINQRTVADRDWRSAEQMRRNDVRYKWGVLVAQNEDAKPQDGSCIFLHVWIGPNVPTVGCTAMAEKDMVDLIRWLNPASNPLLVQMPRKSYEQHRDKWNLPPLR
ncbi:MAG: zinc D-Ala-D-Ala dipeptidase [Verrucomicrobiota bacterium]|jgi:L,D-peptidoglycan transpeptidase YkuD (ErfK/YbiS/YcfS/YnhG family)